MLALVESGSTCVGLPGAPGRTIIVGASAGGVWANSGRANKKKKVPKSRPSLSSGVRPNRFEEFLLAGEMVESFSEKGTAI